MIYFLKRLPSAILTLWLVATLVFLLVKAAGGEAIMGEGRVNEAVRQQIAKEWMLDRPLHEQYWMHMKKLAVFDSMPSRKQKGKTLRTILAETFPASLNLGVRALIIALLFGIPLGILCAVHHNGVVDQASVTLALFGVSVPSFILSSLFIFVFTTKLGWLPATEWQAPFFAIPPPWDKVGNVLFSRMWVPACCLAAFPFAAILRLTRASMIEALREDYVRTATAKGLRATTVIVRHAFRNALTPVVTYLGPVTAGVLTGSLVVEKIFAIPGIGRLFTSSVSDRDMAIIMGLAVFYCALLVFLNLIVDALYPILNPRLRK